MPPSRKAMAVNVARDLPSEMGGGSSIRPTGASGHVSGGCGHRAGVSRWGVAGAAVCEQRGAPPRDVPARLQPRASRDSLPASAGVRGSRAPVGWEERRGTPANDVLGPQGAGAPKGRGAAHPRGKTKPRSGKTEKGATRGTGTDTKPSRSDTTKPGAHRCYKRSETTGTPLAGAWNRSRSQANERNQYSSTVPGIE